MKLSEEAKEARRAYARSWRKNNPDKVRQYNETYWERKAQEAKEDIKYGKTE